MAFIDGLAQVTGTEEREGGIVLIGSERQGSVRYLNSGVVVLIPFELPSKSKVSIGGKEIELQSGVRSSITDLEMHPEDPPENPHIHVRQELILVNDGSFFDADVNGNPLRTYKKGDKIWYGPFSSHRPVTTEGADLTYITLDGMIRKEGDFDPRVLLTKAKRAGMQSNMDAVEFALLWMVTDESDRIQIMRELFS